MATRANHCGWLQAMAAIAVASPAVQATETAAATDAVSWALPRDAEAAVRAWIEPLRLGQDVAPGLALANVRLQRDELALCVRAGAALPCAVVRPGDRQLAVACQPDLPAPACQRMTDLFSARPLATSPWTAMPAGQRAGQPQSPWQGWARAAALCCWAAWLAAMAWVAWTAGCTARRGAALFGLLAVAVAVRVAGSPRTFLHESYRIDLHTRFLIDGSTWPYGEAATAPVYWLDRLAGTGIDAMFWLHLLAGAAAAPLCVWMSEALFGAGAGAWAGGCLVALAPVLVRWGACEESGPILLAAATSAVAATAIWVRHETPRHLALAAAGCALALNARPEWAPLPAVLLLLVPAVGGRQGLQRLKSPLALAAAGLAAAAWLPHLLENHPIMGHAPAIVWGRALALLFVTDGALLPAFAAVLAAGGLAWSWRTANWPAVWLLAVCLSMGLLPLLFFSTAGPFAHRSQFVPAAWALVLAGLAVNWGPAQPWRAGLATAVALLAAWHLAAAWPDVTAEYTLQAQWRTQQQAAQKLPARARLIACAGAQPLERFPRLALRDRPHVQILDLAGFDQSGSWPPPQADLYLWLGMHCWLAPLPHLAGMQDPAGTCARARRQYALEPVLEAKLTVPAYPPQLTVPAPPGGYLVGLYRVAADR